MTIQRIRLVSLLTLLAAPAGAHAAAIVFDHSNSPTVTVFANDFEFGFNLEGSPFQSGLNSPAITSLLESDSPITFSGSWVDLGASGSGSRTLYVVEPGTNEIKDMITYSWSTDGNAGTITGSYSAGPGLGTPPGNVNPLDVFAAYGTPVGFALPFLGGEIRPVPEPVHGGLLAGLAFLALGRKRSARRRSH